MKNYKPCVIWITGLSGSGKTTIANELQKNVKKENVNCVILDGDEIRNIFDNKDFSKESRIRHNINVGSIASLLEKQECIVIVSLISPFREARDKCREMASNFIEVYINTSLKICEDRDVKGLYKKARSGEIRKFTGINDEYESPLHPEIILDTEVINLETCTNNIIFKIKS